MPTVPTPSRAIFASNAKAGEMVAFPDWLRGWGLTFDPGQTEGIPPMEWMNGAFNQLSSGVAYLLQRGIAPYDPAETYPKDAVVSYNGTVWIAKRAVTNIVPGTSRDDWDVASGASGYMFQTDWWPGKRENIPEGFGPGDGQLLLRSAYPDTLAAIQAGKVPVVTDAEWLADPLKRGCYTLGDGSTNFRVPDYNGKHAGSLGALFMRGDGANSAGSPGMVQGDAIRNITGVSPKIAGASEGGFDGVGAGAFGLRSILNGKSYPTSVSAAQPAGIADFDASRVVPTAAENRPVAVTGCWIIRLFGAVTNAGSADAGALATAYASLAGRVSTVESNKLDKTNGFGQAQTWQNVTSSRVPDTTYTNTTGKPIAVYIVRGATSAVQSLKATVNGQVLPHHTTAANVAVKLSMFFIVPVGGTYSITTSGTDNTGSEWMELR